MPCIAYDVPDTIVIVTIAIAIPTATAIIITRWGRGMDAASPSLGPRLQEMLYYATLCYNITYNNTTY